MTPKKITRRQINAWFHPIRACFAEMRTGEVDSVQGYAVTRLHNDDEYTRTDYCIEGWVCVLRRVLPGFDVTAIVRLQKKLANGVALTVREIDDALRVLRAAETPLLKTPWQQIKDAVMVEQIAIELEEMRVAA